MPTQVATYQLDDSTTVTFEIEPSDGFRPAGPSQIVGRVRDAVGPAIEAAREVLDKAKGLCPDDVEVAFGIKVSGGAQWLVAKAAGEASFEITLRWSSKPKPPDTVTARPGESAGSAVAGEHGAMPDESAELVAE